MTGFQHRANYLHLPAVKMEVLNTMGISMQKSFVVLLLSFCCSVTFAQPADFDRFTTVLTKQLETDMLGALALGMKLDFSTKLCSRVGGAAEADLNSEVLAWQKRNDPYIKASVEVLNAFGNRYFEVGSEKARQTYLQKMGQSAGKDANEQVMRKLNGASLNNTVVPSERNCKELATFLRDRAFEIEGMRSSIRALRPYMERKSAPVALDVAGGAITTESRNASLAYIGTMNFVIGRVGRDCLHLIGRSDTPQAFVAPWQQRNMKYLAASQKYMDAHLDEAQALGGQKQREASMTTLGNAVRSGAEEIVTSVLNGTDKINACKKAVEQIESGKFDFSSTSPMYAELESLVVWAGR